MKHIRMLILIFGITQTLPAQTPPPTSFEAVVAEIQHRRLPATTQNDDGSFTWAFLLVSRQDLPDLEPESASKFLLHYHPSSKSYHGDLLNLRAGTTQSQALSTLLSVLRTNLSSSPGLPDVCTLEGRRYYLLKF